MVGWVGRGEFFSGVESFGFFLWRGSFVFVIRKSLSGFFFYYFGIG